MLMAMQYATKYAGLVFSKNASNQRRLSRMHTYSARLSALLGKLNANEPVDPDDLHRELKLATIAYTNLFYGASSRDISYFLSSCLSESVVIRVPPERNIITMPAIFAANGIKIGRATQLLLKSLHRKSFMVFKDACKAATMVELFRASSAMGPSKGEAVSRLDSYASEIDEVLRNMDYWSKDAAANYSKKVDLITKLAAMESHTGISATDIIEGSLAPYSDAKHTIIRK